MPLHTENHPISTIKKSIPGNQNLDALTHAVIVLSTTVFPLSKILSHFVRKPRFNNHQNCVTNTINRRDKNIQRGQSQSVNTFTSPCCEFASLLPRSMSSKPSPSRSPGICDRRLTKPMLVVPVKR